MNEGTDAVNNKEAPPPIQGSGIPHNPPADISSSSITSVSKSKTPCKFFLSKRGCTYGSECKFAHVSMDATAEESKDGRLRGTARARKASRPPVCRLYLSSTSGCKYGEKCRYRHPARSNVGEERGGDDVEQRLSDNLEGATLDGSGEHREERNSPSATDDQAALLNMQTFPGLGSAGNSVTRQEQTAIVTPSHTHTSHSHKSHSSQSRRHAPSELSLASFMTTPTVGVRPHPPVSRPQRNSNKTTAELRQAELEQLETRFQGSYSLVEKGRERSVYLLTVVPTDPDWNFPFKTFDLEVTFPRDYPSQPLAANLPNDQELHPTYINHGNLAIARYLATAPGGSELMFRPFMHWLDKTVTNVFRDAAKEVVSSELFDGANDETTPPEDHTPFASDEEEEEESSEDDQSDDESDEQQLPLLVTSEKRGTEMRLSGIVMSEGVGVGRCASVRVTLQCTRCRGQQDETVKAESPTSQLCSQCQHCFSFSYRPALFHPTSSTLGFLDLQGCLPVDLVLMQSELILSCLECGRDNTTSGLNYGEHRDMWCKRCHVKLSLYVEQCRFVQHQPGTTVLPSTSSSGRRTARKAREAVIQVGRLLPEFGTCVHYKRSNRWLRFPCCGKPFPCDQCHDECQDHVMERANRMICGFCSREQTYSSSSPCVGCGGDLVGGRAGTFWEGGKGCRNKTKMSRNDLHKYTNSVQKTQCKKQERVGRKVTAART